MTETFPDPLSEARRRHQAGELEAAEQLYRQAMQRGAGVEAGETVEARLGLGKVLIDLARLAEATEVLGQLVVEDPQHAAGWVQLARAIEPQGFAWEAHGAITRALKAKPDPQSLIEISMLLLGMRDAGGAESAARRAVKMSPDSVYAWLQLGQVLSARNKPDKAADAYRRAAANDPSNSVAAFIAAGIDAGDSKRAGLVPNRAPMLAPPEYVRGLFDGLAERFDAQLVASLKYRTPERLAKLFEGWLERGAEAAKPALVMMDAGCGTGLCGLWMARYRGRLVGVDLSRRMLAESRLRGVYDELFPGDIVDELSKRPGEFDLIVAGDVMVYLGDLVGIFKAAAAALRPGGIFLFSVEATMQQDYVLLPTHRFAHHKGYLHRLCGQNGLAMKVEEESVLRQEKGKDVRGYLLLAQAIAKKFQ